MDFFANLDPNQVIFYAVDFSLSFFLKISKSLIFHLNSSFDLIKFQEALLKYLNSVWIRPLFTIILSNVLLFLKIGEGGIFLRCLRVYSVILWNRLVIVL